MKAPAIVCSVKHCRKSSAVSFDNVTHCIFRRLCEEHWCQYCEETKGMEELESWLERVGK